MNNTALLAIFTGLSINLVVQFGLGVRDIIGIKHYQFRFSLYQGLVLFFSVIITWLVFVYILIPLGFGFLETLLLLPLSILFSSLIEKGTLFLLSKWVTPANTSVFSAYNGMVFGANFFTLKVAGSFIEALIMAVGFALGYILSMAIVQEINKRSSIEAVPAALRGAPLLIISIGLLSLVFSAAAAFFLQMVNIF